MICPVCGAEMSIGSPHDDAWIYQYECSQCDYIKGVYGAYQNDR